MRVKFPNGSEVEITADELRWLELTKPDQIREFLSSLGEPKPPLGFTQGVTEEKK